MYGIIIFEMISMALEVKDIFLPSFFVSIMIWKYFRCSPLSVCNLVNYLSPFFLFLTKERELRGGKNRSDKNSLSEIQFFFFLYVKRISDFFSLFNYRMMNYFVVWLMAKTLI